MDRPAFVDGLRDAAPAVPPHVPFGMLFGATAVEVGFDPAAATALSLFAFAGAAQMAAVELLADGAALPVVLVTILLLNLRYVIFSASLVPEVRHLPASWRAVIAYPLFDITYALAAARFREDDAARGTGSPSTAAGATSDAAGATSDAADPSREVGHRGWYYLGTAVPLVGALTVFTLAGALVGRAFGQGLSLSFAVPLIFISLVAPTIDSTPTAVTAGVATLVAVVGAGLPFNAGLLIAAVCGTAAGAVVQRRGSGSDPGSESGPEPGGEP